MIRRPRDLTELECLYTDDDTASCRQYLEETMETETETETVYRFSSGVEVTARDLKKSDAGRELARFARHVQKQRGISFAEALRLSMTMHPETTTMYLGLD